MEFKVIVSDGKASLFTPYNADFVKRIKLLGGRWNGSEKCWTVSETALDDARAVMREIYGRDDSAPAETVDVLLRFECEVDEWHGPVTILGRTIATAYGRDSGARTGDQAWFIKGNPTSGGSVKNWHTVVPAGCEVKLPSVPVSILENASLPVGVEMEIIGRTVDRDALLKEKEDLLARLAEIDRLLQA